MCVCIFLRNFFAGYILGACYFAQIVVSFRLELDDVNALSGGMFDLGYSYGVACSVMLSFVAWCVLGFVRGVNKTRKYKFPFLNGCVAVLAVSFLFFLGRFCAVKPRILCGTYLLTYALAFLGEIFVINGLFNGIFCGKFCFAGCALSFCVVLSKIIFALIFRINSFLVAYGSVFLIGKVLFFLLCLLGFYRHLLGVRMRRVCLLLCLFFGLFCFLGYFMLYGFSCRRIGFFALQAVLLCLLYCFLAEYSGKFPMYIFFYLFCLCLCFLLFFHSSFPLKYFCFQDRLGRVLGMLQLFYEMNGFKGVLFGSNVVFPFYAHNVLVEVFLSFGICGGLAWLLMCLYPFYLVIKNSENFNVFVCVVLFCLVFAFLQMFFSGHICSGIQVYMIAYFLHYYYDKKLYLRCGGKM